MFSSDNRKKHKKNNSASDGTAPHSNPEKPAVNSTALSMQLLNGNSHPHPQDDKLEEHHQVKAFIRTKKATLAKAKPLVGISVGYGYHHGEYLVSILSLLQAQIEEGNYKNQNVTVLICGTLQRHNIFGFTAKMSDAELKLKLQNLPVYREGDEYLNELALALAERFLSDTHTLEENYDHFLRDTLSENENQFNTLNKRIEISKWTDCIFESNNKENPFSGVYPIYRAKYLELMKHYNASVEFQKAVDARIDEFHHDDNKYKDFKSQVERIKQANPDLASADFNKLFRLLSRNYLLEEIPMLLVLADHYGFTHHLYPSKAMPEAFAMAFKLLNKTALEWSHICFTDVDPSSKLERINKEIAALSMKIGLKKQEAEKVLHPHGSVGVTQQMLLRKQFEEEAGATLFPEDDLELKSYPSPSPTSSPFSTEWDEKTLPGLPAGADRPSSSIDTAIVPSVPPRSFSAPPTEESKGDSNGQVATTSLLVHMPKNVLKTFQLKMFEPGFQQAIERKMMELMIEDYERKSNRKGERKSGRII